MFQGLVLLDDENRTDDTDNCPLHHIARPTKSNKYCSDSIIQIQVTYIIASIIWIFLIFLLGIYKRRRCSHTNWIGWFILALPIIVFIINYINLSSITHEVESEMLKGNFLSFAFLITVILINWSKIPDKTQYFMILLLALVLLMLSLIDLWVAPCNMPIIRHVRTIFHTTALSLLVYGLFLYYGDAILADDAKHNVIDLPDQSDS